MDLKIHTGILLLGLACSPSALAETFTCDGNFGPGEVFDDITVPSGGTCVLYLSTVNGDVSVPENAGFASLGSTIYGNLNTRDSLLVYLVQSEPGPPSSATETRIEGNVSIQRTVPTGINLICETSIQGNLKLKGNAAFTSMGDPDHCFAGVSVAGNATINENTGGLLISNNWIGKKLSCKKNSPAPAGIPGSNQVGGKAKYQCQSLAGE